MSDFVDSSGKTHSSANIAPPTAQTVIGHFESSGSKCETTRCDEQQT
jgi:hypothetical protein